tara:strand:- start:2165 stop:2470 length:306 start_codon:yes stop_codon:yes gene_type:complete
MSTFEKYGHTFKNEEVINPNNSVRYELFKRCYKRKYILFGSNVDYWKEEKRHEHIFSRTRVVSIPKPFSTIGEAYELVEHRYKPIERREITEDELAIIRID